MMAIGQLQIDAAIVRIVTSFVLSAAQSWALACPSDWARAT